MEKIKVLVVEDEWLVSEEITVILQKRGFDVVGQAEDADTALELAMKHNPDIALLDVNIKGKKDGIELAHLLGQKVDCGVIFLTAYEDQKFVDRAKEVNPQAYLIKPFQESNLVIAINLAFHNMARQQEESEDVFMLEDRVFIKDGTRFFKLELQKIKYVEADGSYCNVIAENSRHTLALNLKAFESKLDNPTLVRIHRSYLVNLQHVDALEGNLLFIEDKSLPVSQSYYEDVMRRLKLI